MNSVDSPDSPDSPDLSFVGSVSTIFQHVSHTVRILTLPSVGPFYQDMVDMSY